MFTNRMLTAAAVGLAAWLSTSAALAQKAQDTLRIGLQDPVSTVDIVYDPKPETSFTSEAVFDGLLTYVSETREFKPELAASWRRIDPRTLEFSLRHDVTFHDGSPFTADDVVHTINYLVDPASKIRFGDNWQWIDHAEKIDPYTVRIIAKKPTAYDLARLATNTPIYPAAIHGKLADKSEFGRKTPIGTGPYKVEYVDPTKGVMLVRNPDYKLGAAWRPAARIGRIHLIPIPDLQTEIAQLMTGGLDLIHEVPKDQAEQLAATPGFAMTANPGVVFYYMSLDSVNRSGNAALSNQDVRKALMMAVDRKSLVQNVVPGGKAVQIVDALCVKIQIGCEYGSAPPSFDTTGAKQLLAKAGFPDGFDAEITTFPGAYAVAEAVAGQLRKIGVRTSVDKRTFVGYRDKQREGKLQILVGHWSSGGLPDVASTMTYYFGGGPRDYWHDSTIDKWAAEAEGQMDPAKRGTLYRQVFDHVNAHDYIMPLTTFPSILVHVSDLVVEPGSLSPAGAALDMMHWK
ncbi:MAG TPA: ABC transporter substrate-binding protein [Alphaproteobacteria bacterium]|nr:ABC transporter substrate-binding protein [Alphaproteobacteria bacterium]